MLVCFPGLRTFFRMLFRFAPSNKFITFVVGHLKTVIENRRRDKEVTTLGFSINNPHPIFSYEEEKNILKGVSKIL